MIQQSNERLTMNVMFFSYRKGIISSQVYEITQWYLLSCRMTWQRASMKASGSLLAASVSGATLLPNARCGWTTQCDESYSMHQQKQWTCHSSVIEYLKNDITIQKHQTMLKHVEQNTYSSTDDDWWNVLNCVMFKKTTIRTTTVWPMTIN